MSDNLPLDSKTGHYRIDYEYAKLREVVLGGTQIMLPHKGTIFFSDHHSGLWAVRLKESEEDEEEGK